MNLTAQEQGLVELARAVRLQTIEECARVVEQHEHWQGVDLIAAAIRALKDKTGE